MGGFQVQSDDALSVARVTYENGGTNSTVIIPKEGGKLSVGVHLSGVTAYHLLEGNLSVSNTVSTNGFSTTLYTGNGSTQSINTGVDMNTQWGNDASERYGGLVWLKDRGAVENNNLFDTLRGTNNQLATNLTIANTSYSNSVTAFNNNGFSVGGAAGINTSAHSYASWNFQTTHRRSGTTNHGMTYTEHYNPYTGFTMIKYTGSGIAGHEIPHSLGRRLGFITFKNLSAVSNWLTYPIAVSKTGFMYLELTQAMGEDSTTTYEENTITMNNTYNNCNSSSNTYIMYGWTNSYLDKSNKLIGNYEIGTYIGTGLAGNKIKTRDKPAWILVKGLNGATSWKIFDNLRTNGTPEELYLNSNSIEVSSTLLNINNDGFTWVTNNTTETNVLGGIYLYMVVYDNDSGSGKSKYPKAGDTSTLNINNAKIPFANGIDINGTRITALLRNEVISGLTLTPGKNYVYMKNDGTYGVTPYAPNLDSYSGFGDYFDSKKNKWYKNVSIIADDFNDGTLQGWVASDNGIVTNVNGTLKTFMGTIDSMHAYKALTCVVGKQYKLNIKVNTGTDDTYLCIGDASLPTKYVGQVVTKGSTSSVTFIADVTTVYIRLFLNTTTDNTYTFTDYISVYPINQDGTIDLSNAVEITESRNYLNHIVYADHNGQVTYVEELPKAQYTKELTVSDKLTLQNVKSIDSNGDVVHKINGVEKMRVKEDGSILNQDGVALSSGGFKNLLINGKMEIAQRGSSFTNAYGYTLDRWKVARYAVRNNTVSQQSEYGLGSTYTFIRVGFGGVGGGTLYLNQAIESINSKRMRGKYVTLSFLARGSTNYPIQAMINYATASDGASDNQSMYYHLFNTVNNGLFRTTCNLTTVWQKFTLTVYIPNDVMQIGVSFGDMDYSDSRTMDFTNIQLEEGTVATAYENRDYALELMMCQRYYEVGVFGLINMTSLSTDIGSYVNFTVTKRITPTMTISSGANQDVSTFGFRWYATTPAHSWSRGTWSASAEL